MAKKRNDELGMTTAKALATLTVGKRYTLAESGDVREGFAEIVKAIRASRDHEQRIKKLEAEIARLSKPQLKVAS